MNAAVALILRAMAASGCALQKSDKAFLLCLGCNAVTSLLLWHSKMSDVVYAGITATTTGAYIGAWATYQIKGTPADRAANPSPEKATP